MLEFQLLAGIAKGELFVAQPVVRHDAGDGDAEAFVVCDGGLEESNGADCFFIGQDVREGDPGGIVDADVDMLPSHAS